MIFALGILFFISLAPAQLIYYISPEISPSTFSLPLELETSLSKKIKLNHRSIFFESSHQFDRYVWHHYNQNNLTYVSDISFLEYVDSNFSNKIWKRLFK